MGWPAAGSCPSSRPRRPCAICALPSASSRCWAITTGGTTGPAAGAPSRPRASTCSKTRRRRARSGATTLGGLRALPRGGRPALGVALVLAAASLWGLLAASRARIGDLLFSTRPAQSARSTVIVGIDEKSYQALLARHGPLSAWPRTLYADALDALRPAAPRVVAFAIFFDAQRPEDGALAEAMRRARHVTAPGVGRGGKAFG